jgi:hypothetical protein
MKSSEVMNLFSLEGKTVGAGHRRMLRDRLCIATALHGAGAKIAILRHQRRLCGKGPEGL